MDIGKFHFTIMVKPGVILYDISGLVYCLIIMVLHIGFPLIHIFGLSLDVDQQMAQYGKRLRFP